MLTLPSCLAKKSKNQSTESKNERPFHRSCALIKEIMKSFNASTSDLNSMISTKLYVQHVIPLTANPILIASDIYLNLSDGNMFSEAHCGSVGRIMNPNSDTHLLLKYPFDPQLLVLPSKSACRIFVGFSESGKTAGQPAWSGFSKLQMIHFVTLKSPPNIRATSDQIEVHIGER